MAAFLVHSGLLFSTKEHQQEKEQAVGPPASTGSRIRTREAVGSGFIYKLPEPPASSGKQNKTVPPRSRGS